MNALILVSVVILWIVLGAIPLVVCIRSSQFTKEVNDYEAYLKKESVPLAEIEQKASVSEEVSH